MADENTTVTVKILADAEGFKKGVKEAAKSSTDLSKLTDQFRKSGMKGHKALSKITKKHNKSEAMAGKKALALEKKLERQMLTTIKLMKEKQKTFKGNADAIKEETAQLAKLKKAYDGVHAHRKSTGYKTARERVSDFKNNNRIPTRYVRRTVKAIAGVLIAGVGAAVGAVASQVRSGYAAYTNYGRARAGLSGMGRIRGGLSMHHGGATGVFGTAEKLGFSATETVQQMRGIGRQTGNINAVSLAQRTARSFGGDVGQIGGFMGTLTRSGSGFGGTMGRKGERTLLRVMQHAFTGGLDKSRAGEHLSAVAQAVGSAQSVRGGKVNADAISSLLTLFSKSGQPGLMGAAGLAQLSKIDAGIKKVGFGPGGDAASSMIMQAMGFGVPGGTTSFYDATKAAQQGVFGEGGARNLMNVFQRFGQAGGGMGTEESNLMLSRTFGLSLDVVEKINQVISQRGGTDSALEEIAELTEQALPTEERILEVDKEHLEVAKHVAELDNRLVGIGAKTYESIVRIENTINEMVTALMPTAIKVLEKIAEILENIWSWIQNVLGKVYADETTKEQLGVSRGAQNKILAKVASGKMAAYDAADAIMATLPSAPDDVGELSLSNIIGAQGLNSASRRRLWATKNAAGMSRAVLGGETNPAVVRLMGRLAEARYRQEEIEPLKQLALSSGASPDSNTATGRALREATRLQGVVQDLQSQIADQRMLERTRRFENPEPSNIDPGTGRLGQTPGSSVTR